MLQRDLHTLVFEIGPTVDAATALIVDMLSIKQIASTGPVRALPASRVVEISLCLFMLCESAIIRYDG